MFFHYSQNNSGGSFDFDRERGITHHVVIEANSADDANERAEAIGLYFDGCDAGIDCDCCGDRWYAKWENSAGYAEPTVYGQPAFEVEHHTRWMAPNPEVVIHYADGRIEWEPTNGRPPRVRRADAAVRRSPGAAA